MVDRVLEVHGIASAAAGWKRRKDGQQVACFVLVTKADSDSLSITEKVVLPLAAVDMTFGLVGRDVDDLADDIVFVDPASSSRGDPSAD